MDYRLTRYEALLACKEAAGGVTQMARDLGVPQPTMSRWLNSSKQLPAEYVLTAERLYGVSRHVLRPDIYPVEVVGPRADFIGVDRGTGRVSFQNGSISQAADAA